jgi:hypothetical protein
VVYGGSPATCGETPAADTVVGGGAPAASRHHPLLILNYLINIFIIILFK